jgi:hypothetical protein
MNRRKARMILMVAATVSACWSEGMPLENTGEADGICTDPDCDDTVTVDVTRRDEQIFPPGEYTFSMEIEAGSPRVAGCTMEEDYSLSCTGSASLNVRIHADLDRFIIRADDQSPEQLLVVVEFEGTEIGAEILIPNYEYVGSADPDCTLTCMQGTAEMRTAAPPS